MTDVYVRRANTNDIPWLLREVYAFEAHAGYKRHLIQSDDVVQEILGNLIREHVVLIATLPPAGDPIGFMLGVVGQHPLAPHLLIQSDFMWWVPQIYKSTGAARALLDAFIEVGKMRADWVTVSLAPKTQVRDAHFLKRGFREDSRTFLLEVN